MEITFSQQINNQKIISEVERAGGGCIWEDEIFAVTLLDLTPTETQARALLGLVGVRQIAINSKLLTYSTLVDLSKIKGLESLVISEFDLSTDQLSELLANCGEVIALGQEA